MENKVFGWIAALIGTFLLIPLVAMQLTNEVDWSMSDFIIMGTLIFTMASVFVFAARRMPKHRLFIGIAILIAFILVWAHLAVGIVDTWPLAGS